jgi:hypothetical protein
MPKRLARTLSTICGVIGPGRAAVSQSSTLMRSAYLSLPRTRFSSPITAGSARAEYDRNT